MRGRGAWRDGEIHQGGTRMIESQAGAPVASGRPSAGHLLKQAFQAAAGRRTVERNLSPLRRLLPHFRAHLPDTMFSIFFVVLSSASALGLSAVGRQLVDGGMGQHTQAALLQSFLVAGAGAVAFALTTALRIYFVNKLGE